MFPRIPLKRFQTPEDMGYMVAFLLSDEAENITGQTNYADGGMGIMPPSFSGLAN